MHVRAWLATYRGLMRDDVLDGLDEQRSVDRWERSLAEPQPPGRHVLVVETEEGDVAGFAVIGPERDGPPGWGEVYAINIDPPQHGRGLGQALLAGAAVHLHEAGYANAALWVADGNDRARRFYAAAGWSDTSQRKRSPELGVDELRYTRSLTPTA